MGDFYASQDILLNSLSTAERNLSTPDQFSRNMNHAVSLSSLGQEEDYDLFIGDIIELICRATAITGTFKFSFLVNSLVNRRVLSNFSTARG